jgi:hypothetical protein
LTDRWPWISEKMAWLTDRCSWISTKMARINDRWYWQYGLISWQNGLI